MPFRLIGTTTRDLVNPPEASFSREAQRPEIGGGGMASPFYRSCELRAFS